jgi:hypothetical protein
MRKILGVAVALSLVLGATSAFAVSGDIQATANVLTPLSVTNNLRDLDFGDVFPGINKSIAYDAGTSGKWQIDGQLGREVDITFTLPAVLTSGGNTMPIAFGANDAAWNTADIVGAATTFDPAVGATEFLDVGTGQMFVWIGGTVQPPETQAGGAYSGTITMDVVYTGN